MIKSYCVIFQPMEKFVSVEADTTVSGAASKAEIDLVSTCGGKGSCGQCGVLITKGIVPAASPQDEKVFSKDELALGYRLACCARVNENLTVHLPDKALNKRIRVQLGNDESVEQLIPMVKVYDVSFPDADPENTNGCLERIITVMKEKNYCSDPVADHRVVGQLPGMIREHSSQVSIYSRGNEIIGIAAPKANPTGLAVDLGTTKLACHLVDLITGKELTAVGDLNPQVRYGEDVMSRLQFACSNPDSATLSALISSKLNELILKLTAEANVPTHQIVDICIAANTAIIHLLLGLPVRQLASAPYVPATCKSFDVKAQELGLNIAPGGYVHIFPSIGGFVGGDHVAMILATGIHRMDKIVLGIDVGTNTEIVLRNPGVNSLLSVSCPSGPAFEGAHILNGMRAAEGAIESVKINDEGIYCRTIGDAPAIGLCGSGIIDTVAELYRLRWINEQGRFQLKNKNILSDENGGKVLLASETKNGNSKDIFFTQKDLNEFQLAKGSIRAGIDILLEVSDIQPDSIDEIIIAGAFGSYLNPANAVSIGLIPDIPVSYIRQVGNASADGAKKALLSRYARKEAQQIADQTRHVELTRHPKFSRCFASGMLLPAQ